MISMVLCVRIHHIPPAKKNKSRAIRVYSGEMKIIICQGPRNIPSMGWKLPWGYGLFWVGQLAFPGTSTGSRPDLSVQKFGRLTQVHMSQMIATWHVVVGSTTGRAYHSGLTQWLQPWGSSLRTKVWYSALQFHLLLGLILRSWATSVHPSSSASMEGRRENWPETLLLPGENQLSAGVLFIFFKRHPLGKSPKVSDEKVCKRNSRYYISFQGAVALAKHKFAEVDGIHSSQQQVSATGHSGLEASPTAG